MGEVLSPTWRRTGEQGWERRRGSEEMEMRRQGRHGASSFYFEACQFCGNDSVVPWKPT